MDRAQGLCAFLWPETKPQDLIQPTDPAESLTICLKTLKTLRDNCKKALEGKDAFSLCWDSISEAFADVAGSIGEAIGMVTVESMY